MARDGSAHILFGPSYDSSVFFGAVLAFAGITLAVAPLQAAQFAHRLRFVPYNSDENSLNGYRRAGWVIFTLGVALAALIR